MNNECTENDKRLAVCTWQPSVLMREVATGLMRLVLYHPYNKHTFVGLDGKLQTEPWNDDDMAWQLDTFNYEDSGVAEEGSEEVVTWARSWLDMDHVDKEMPNLKATCGFARRVGLAQILAQEAAASTQ
jgi:hypothetical protein